MNRILYWKAELAAPLLGILLTLSFAPYDYIYAALPALTFLYLVWNKVGARRAFNIGYLFGLGLFGSGIWWVYISIHDYGGADELSAGFLTLLLVAIWALFPAITGVLTTKALKFTGAGSRIFASALLWVAVEYFRGYWLLNGFPWLQIAYTQLHTPLAGYASVLGVYGIGFLLAASAFTFAEMLNRKLMPMHGFLILAIIWTGGALLKTRHWTHANGEPIKITLIQGNISQEQKWLPNQKQNTLQLYQHLTEQHWDSNVIVWPETAIPAFLSQVEEFYLQPLAKTAREHHADLVVSLLTGDSHEYFNSVMALGEKQAFYHKNHLLPFGEYLPLQPLSGWILEMVQIPLGDFTPGKDRQTLLTAGGYPFITTICYEDVFGEQINRQIGEAAYIVNVTNDAWFGNSSQPYQHMQMAQMRALESGRYLVRATNTGLTGFVAPDGNLIKQAPLFTTMTLTDSILPMSGVTPYAMIGDNLVFSILLTLTSLIYLYERLLSRQRQGLGG